MLILLLLCELQLMIISDTAVESYYWLKELGRMRFIIILIASVKGLRFWGSPYSVQSLFDYVVMYLYYTGNKYA